ncbi:hypothetical protein [Cupriavidus sp. WS]|uniref:hypothetical protein n=1 Tax=Cupriavidus sp. WS TaxID=1312922 RepID=UPI0012DDB3D4|nr:hypothetical protein [Cupriavidus sp. WS]
MAALLANIKTAPLAVLRYLQFADQYQSAWLAPVPGLSLRQITVWVNSGIGYAILSIFWTAVILPPILFLRGLSRYAIGGILWCLLALWTGFLGHMLLYKTWNFYAGTLVVPVSGLLVTLCVAAIQDTRAVQWLGGAPRVLMVAFSPLLLLFLCSSALLLFTVLPLTIQSVRALGTGMSQQVLSIPAFGYAAQRTRIRDFAGRCHIQGDGARRLVVDNLTFFAFDNLKEPLQSDYLYDQGFGLDLKGDALPSLLRRIGSTLFSASLMAIAQREGNICCIDLDGKS